MHTATNARDLKIFVQFFFIPIDLTCFPLLQRPSFLIFASEPLQISTMSRFFRSSDTESDSDTSSDNDSQYSQSDSEYDSDAESYHSEVEEEQPKNRFLKGGSDSEDSDDESNKKRQAKSQKDKRIEEMETAVKAIENGQKNNDWNLISTGKIIAAQSRLSFVAANVY